MNHNRILELGIKKLASTINFPKSEHQKLISRLKQNKPIYTTRVSKEKSKYKKGKIYQTPWGDNLKVINVKEFNDINRHPFYNELNKNQINTIARYGDYDFLKLTKQAKDSRFEGVSLKQDKKGWYVHTHRARSKSYPSPEKIPESKIKFIRSTGK